LVSKQRRLWVTSYSTRLIILNTRYSCNARCSNNPA
jgi:hypothetical protein